jgi:tripartite-type tricarboxylate transporter receptor subunit TctC
MVLAPAATPAPIIDRLGAELTAAAKTPEVNSFISKLGNIPVDSPPPRELQKFLAAEIERWGDLIERAGLAQTL